MCRTSRVSGSGSTGAPCPRHRQPRTGAAGRSLPLLLVAPAVLLLLTVSSRRDENAHIAGDDRRPLRRWEHARLFRHHPELKPADVLVSGPPNGTGSMMDGIPLEMLGKRFNENPSSEYEYTCLLERGLQNVSNGPVTSATTRLLWKIYNAIQPDWEKIAAEHGQSTNSTFVFELQQQYRAAIGETDEQAQKVYERLKEKGVFTNPSSNSRSKRPLEEEVPQLQGVISLISLHEADKRRRARRRDSLSVGDIALEDKYERGASECNKTEERIRKDFLKIVAAIHAYDREEEHEVRRRHPEIDLLVKWAKNHPELNAISRFYGVKDILQSLALSQNLVEFSKCFDESIIFRRYFTILEGPVREIMYRRMIYEGRGLEVQAEKANDQARLQKEAAARTDHFDKVQHKSRKFSKEFVDLRLPFPYVNLGILRLNPVSYFPDVLSLDRFPI